MLTLPWPVSGSSSWQDKTRQQPVSVGWKVKGQPGGALEGGFYRQKEKDDSVHSSLSEQYVNSLSPSAHLFIRHLIMSVEWMDSYCEQSSWPTDDLSLTLRKCERIFLSFSPLFPLSDASHHHTPSLFSYNSTSQNVLMFYSGGFKVILKIIYWHIYISN